MLNKRIVLIGLLASLAANNELEAGTLTSYSIGDVLLCFRIASGAGAANDLVVDAGPVSTFVSGTNNQRFPITQYAGNQLALVGTNSVIWSAFGWYDDSVSPVSSQWDLFISKPRTSPYAKTTPWTAQSSNGQQLPAGQMSEVPPGAAANLGYVGAKGLNTASAIVEPDDTTGNSTSYPQGECYDYVVGPNFDFQGEWEGNVEITAPANFITAGKVIRSDFYQMSPSDTGTGLTTWLGYFEFNTNGAMTFVAKPAAPTVTTLAASALTATNAQLNATVNPLGDGATLYFQYGTNGSYGKTSVTNIIGTTTGTYGLAISNLIAGTTYHFRAAAYNRAGTNYGADLIFTTLSSSVAVAVPVITGLFRTNGISYVSFTTGNSGTYTLRGTNSAGLGGAPATWPPIASVAGNDLTNTLQDTGASANQFYIISAQ